MVGGVFVYLIPCSHRCIHQREGYCTLESLSRAASSTGGDCIYFQEKSAKQAAKLTDRTDPGQLKPGMIFQVNRLDVVSRQDDPPES